jgi:RNA polymerase II subunit A C-terminal domain phosphatase SSU72
MGMDGANDAHAESNMVADDKFKLKFCTVCASNQNRYVSSAIAIAPPLT